MNNTELNEMNTKINEASEFNFEALPYAYRVAIAEDETIAKAYAVVTELRELNAEAGIIIAHEEGMELLCSNKAKELIQADLDAISMVFALSGNIH